MLWKKQVRAGCALALVAALAACGGGDEGQNGGTTMPDGRPTPAPTPVPTPAPSVAARKVLLVELDGLTYPQLKDGIAQGRLPNLATLRARPAYSGGVNGTLTQQPTLDAPGWATLLTGSWANRHQVRSDAPGQAMQADSVFKLLKDGRSAKTAGVTGSPALAQLLAREQNAGRLDSLTDCAGVDSCVADGASARIRDGYDLVYAQFHSPADAAASSGFQQGYRNVLGNLDAAVGRLQAAVAQRTAANPGEDWLIVVTAAHGLAKTGSSDGLPVLDNALTFIALNRDGNALLGSDDAAPDSFDALYARASLADITPTVLAFAGAQPGLAGHAIDGAPLLADPAVAQLRSKAGSDHASVQLSWRSFSDASRSIEIWRDGRKLQTLPGDATAYTDSSVAQATSGLYRFNYTVVANGIPVSLLAQLDYVKPVVLERSLTNGLLYFYGFDGGITDARNGSVLQNWATGVDSGSLVADAFGAKALRVDGTIADAGGSTGYKLAQNGADFAGLPQFTIGFWLRTDCVMGTGNGAAIVSNKNYDSGSNPGIALGMFTGCEVRFNIGSGGVRDEIGGSRFSANQWVYLALSVDAANRKMSAYLFDPVIGEQKTENKAIANTDISKLKGLGVLGLNEDGTGQYYKRNCGTPSCATPRGRMEFNDFAVWSRVLTLTELRSIYASNRSLTTLNP
ncbi:alkaline phosphatase family protein [Jeongeupia chitinilytica]|uniref:Nucleotide pyrophosphatase n=1 Tax=Jeongeupia chitinilytica TaxID=1041641 RepID=A0ABQ3H6U5_9NEIS|nr:alkaline phosphatase family protein [Jeongeupia chitinilytica]GHD67540.1 hypothetical protein GCM10007350_31370 [Jeongeupia chitinilytica]